MTFWNHLVPLLLLPAALLAFLGPFERGTRFWLAFGLAALASAGWTVALFASAWSTGFGAALWLTIASSAVLFLLLSLLMADVWRLGALLAPYLLLLALIALAWNQVPPVRPVSGHVPMEWFGTHVVLSLATYVFLTLAAVASAGVMLQERALKGRQGNRMTRALPSLADCERLEYRFLGVSEVVLAAGIVTGLGARYAMNGNLLESDHKTVLTLAAFLVIGALLVARTWWGTRGRRAARLVMTGYLLVTLAYPGVKFVTDVLIG